MAYPIVTMSFHEFVQLRTEEEMNRLFIEGRPPSAFRRHEIIGYHGDNILFESEFFLGRGNIRVPDSPDKGKMLSSIDRAGARIPYRCEFYPSVASQQSEKYQRFGVKYANIDNPVDSVHFTNFNDWFSGWVEDSVVVPDTCIIIEHYLSEVILPRIARARIRIPRFVLLELESIGRRGKEEKRLAFSAFNEIRKLRVDYDAMPFDNPVRADLQARFSELSGSGIIDSLIRTEMWDQRNRYDSMVLVTRDLMMACIASAEDIDAFYLCPAQPERTEFEVQNFPNIITESAVTFNEIRIEGLWEGHSLIIMGMWSGKDIMDWGNRRLRFQLVPH